MINTQLNILNSFNHKELLQTGPKLFKDGWYDYKNGHWYKIEKDNKSLYGFDIINYDLKDKSKFKEIGLEINHIDDFFNKYKDLVDYYIFSSKEVNRNQRYYGKQLDNNVHSDYKYIPGDDKIKNTRIDDIGIRLYGIKNYKAADFYNAGYILKRVQLNQNKLNLIKEKYFKDAKILDLKIKIQDEIEKVLAKNVFVDYKIDVKRREVLFQRTDGNNEIYEIDFNTGNIYKQ